MNQDEDLLPHIAIIGMAARYPGAPNLEAYWDVLRSGRCVMSESSDEDLSHTPKEVLERPNYVRRAGFLEQADGFDANFFGISAREAAIMDPQHRVFLEVCWNAMEHSGYNPELIGGGVGVFAGSGTNLYLHGLLNDHQLRDTIGDMQLGIGNAHDHLTPRVSYQLNLGGLSIPVQTACSTSLVAVHQACQSLLAFECDAALAGGVSIPVPLKNGYLYTENGNLSPDGFCRSFDAQAKGTGRGSGAGVVMLKRLEDAQADGDTIHAVIMGSAVNNDGSQKIGYTAPGVEGQAKVIREAHSVAGIDGDSVTYVEAHGTATTLGDPIEIEALTRAFQSEHTNFCAIGSVKTNMGHCDQAAGVAGLIKAALCIQKRTLVPSLHFEQPNPRIKFSETPFFVNTETIDWEAPEPIAGVSSFGIGGTNAHVVLGAPPLEEAATESSGAQLITLSACSQPALEKRGQDLAKWLDEHEVDIADLAYTLNSGRKPFEYRQTFVVSDLNELKQQLHLDGGYAKINDRQPDTVFLFPGQGTDYPDLGKGLYEENAFFREIVDRCSHILEPHLGLQLTDYLFLDPQDPGRARLLRADLWQPALFVSSYAAASLWINRGFAPSALIGHSVGEYVAAVISGVLQLSDALKLIAERGKATDALEPGAMLAVFEQEENLAKRLPVGIAIAAINGEGLCAVSGDVTSIDELDAQLKLEKTRTIRLSARHAFHSPMMQPVAEKIRALVSTMDVSAPQIPYLSNLTGTWITVQQCADPDYWASHTLEAVRFHQGVEILLNEMEPVFLEPGPGNVLARLIKNRPDSQFACLAPPEGAYDTRTFLGLAGSMFRLGVTPDWSQWFDQSHRRIPLPGYPFEHQRFWHEGSEQIAVAGNNSKLPFEQWFHLPYWRPEPFAGALDMPEAGTHWMMITETEDSTALSWQRWLIEQQQVVVSIQHGEPFTQVDSLNYQIDLSSTRDYAALFHALALEGKAPRFILYFSAGNAGRFINLSQGLAQAEVSTDITVITQNELPVFGGRPSLETASMVGPIRILPKEIRGVQARLMDLDQTPPSLERFFATCLGSDHNEVSAWRGGLRYVETVQQIQGVSQDSKPTYKHEGCYLVVNAFQELGYLIAEDLLKHTNASIILLDRYFFPQVEDHENWIAEHGEQDQISRAILRIGTFEKTRVRVMTGNPANRQILQEIMGSHSINGVFQLERLAPPALLQTFDGVNPLPNAKDRLAETQHILEIFGDTDFILACGANPGETGIAFAQQAALYEITSRMADCDEKGKVRVIDWGTRAWTDTETDDQDPIQKQLAEKREHFGVTPEQAMKIIHQVLSWSYPRLIISTRDYDAVLAQQKQFDADWYHKQLDTRPAGHIRPELSVEFMAPEGDTESRLAEIWCYFFGIDRVGRHDSFFELGGHSLLAVQMLNKLNEELETEIDVQQLFEAPTIAQLAPLIEGEESESLDDTEMAALLDEIEGLSDEDLRAALGD